jgi:hypothetical protein
VKDVLEAMGIPHTEVDLILVNGNAEDFAHRPTSGDRIAWVPLPATSAELTTQDNRARHSRPARAADVAAEPGGVTSTPLATQPVRDESAVCTLTAPSNRSRRTSR